MKNSIIKVFYTVSIYLFFIPLSVKSLVKDSVKPITKKCLVKDTVTINPTNYYLHVITENSRQDDLNTLHSCFISKSKATPLPFDLKEGIKDLKISNRKHIVFGVTNEPTPTQGYGVSMGNNLMIDSRVGELISLRD